MAMRCSSSDRGGRGSRPSAALLPLLLAAACVTTTAVTYLPSAEQPRLDLGDAERTLARFIGVECERLSAAGLDSGRAIVRIVLDTTGTALSSEVLRSSGDARADGLIGAVTAQLSHGMPNPGSEDWRARWRCSGGPSADLVRVPNPAPPGW